MVVSLCSNFSLRESNFSKFAQNKSYGRKNTKTKTKTIFDIYLEIAGDPCNLIDSKQSDLYDSYDLYD